MLKLYIKSILFLLIASALLAIKGYSQRVEIKKIFFKDAKVHLQYVLIDDKSDRSYQIQLYGSTDNFISPLKAVYGDYGVDILPGENKEIIWDPFSEYGEDYDGEIALEIRGRVYIPFVKLDDFNYKKIKRGKAYDITWTGGSSSNILNIELYQSGNKIALFSNIANVGEYSLMLPNNTTPGGGYKLRISDKKNKDDVVFSQEFKVVRKIPLGGQVAAAALAAGGIYFLVSSLGGAEDNSSIQGPPETPGQN